MRRISSKATFWYKRLFPIFWFGVLLVFAGFSLLNFLQTGRLVNPMLVIVPAFMAIFGYFIMTKFIFDLVDEVWDEGDTLYVRNGHVEDRIRLSNIVNVSYSWNTNPPRVTLQLRQPSAFGEKVTFCAPLQFLPFSASPIVDELIKRVDAARQKR